MIYFGFFSLAEPSGTDLFSQAAWVFFHTIRLGGVAMAVLALWSLSGQRLALIVDAVVSIAIGVLLALTGVVMLIDGGGALQSALNVVFGWMFVSAGRRNWSDYYAFKPATEPVPRTARPMASPPHIQPPPQVAEQRAAVPAPVPIAIEEIKPPTPEPKPEPVADEASDDAPGGFLESFADEGPPPPP